MNAIAEFCRADPGAGIADYLQSIALYTAAPEPKRLVVLEGADHNDEVLTVGAPVADAVVVFLRQGA